jgi:hypothetical protein
LAQADLIRNIAAEHIEPLPLQNTNNADSTQAPIKEKEIEATEKNSENIDDTSMQHVNSHFATILQLHFFDHILKPRIDSQKVMSFIDRSKLQDGFTDLLSALHESNYNRQKKAMELISPSSSVDDPCLLPTSQSDKLYPSLKSYGQINCILP